jgi:hypothetical protein
MIIYALPYSASQRDRPQQEENYQTLKRKDYVALVEQRILPYSITCPPQTGK